MHGPECHDREQCNSSQGRPQTYLRGLSGDKSAEEGSWQSLEAGWGRQGQRGQAVQRNNVAQRTDHGVANPGARRLGHPNTCTHHAQGSEYWKRETWNAVSGQNQWACSVRSGESWTDSKVEWSRKDAFGKGVWIEDFQLREWTRHGQTQHASSQTRGRKEQSEWPVTRRKRCQQVNLQSQASEQIPEEWDWVADQGSRQTARRQEEDRRRHQVVASY